MRVTKRIIAHVEEQVNNGLPFGAPTIDCEKAKDLLRNTAAEIEEKADAYVAQLCAEANANLPEGFKVTNSNWSHVNHTWHNAPLVRAASAHEQEVRQKREKAVDGILLSLELGATKADLERLISEAIS